MRVSEKPVYSKSPVVNIRHTKMKKVEAIIKPFA